MSEKDYAENYYKRPCRYCGLEALGVDRINSDAGYIKGNTAPCCGMCNYMKRDYRTEDFLGQCRRITERMDI